MVDQMVAEFARRDSFVLAIPPEGTRKRTEHWRSGFYRIALGANVPVAPGYLDFARKRAGIGPAIRRRDTAACRSSSAWRSRW